MWIANQAKSDQTNRRSKNQSTKKQSALNWILSSFGIITNGTGSEQKQERKIWKINDIVGYWNFLMDH
jgi:hypothetical protein